MARRILLADDSLAIQKVVSLIFEDGDFELVGVTNGDEALAELGRLQPDFVIADVHMPGASGYDVARAVKAASPDTPVLLLVGTFEPFDEMESEASGADGHLLKPFDSAQLQARVEELMGRDAAAELPIEPPPAAEPSAEKISEDELPVEGPAAGPPIEEALPVAEPSPPAESAAWTSPPAAPSGPGATTEPGVGDPGSLTPEAVDRIARRVVELMSADVVREIAREVVPELAEAAVQRRIEELEREAE